MDADICTGKYVQVVCGGGGGLSFVRSGLQRGNEKVRRIKRSLHRIKCGLIRSFDISLITLLLTFNHTLMSGLNQKLFVLYLYCIRNQVRL